MDKIIEVNKIKKVYGSKIAVNDISFYVGKGQIFAFLGTNGAGKTTTIEMICTFLKSDSGNIIVDGKTVGKDDTEIKKVIGIVFQNSLLDDTLSVEENLIIRGSLYGFDKLELDKRIKEVSEMTHISDFLDQYYGTLSGGQKRRVDIARALITKPKILFLDEPTTGLDPQSRKSIWETIIRIQKENNMAVFLTTHYMEEALNADYIVILNKGNIIATGTPSYLRESFSTNKLILDIEKVGKLRDIIKNYDYTIENNKAIIKIKNTLDSIEILKKVENEISGFEVIKGSMEDAFISLTGEELK